MASRAAKSKRTRGSGELAELKSEIREAIDAIGSGRLERGTGAVVLQGYNTLARYLELERRQREVEEIEQRISRLEELRERAATWQI